MAIMELDPAFYGRRLILGEYQRGCAGKNAIIEEKYAVDTVTSGEHTNSKFCGGSGCLAGAGGGKY